MRVVEILLPKGMKDNSLSPQAQRRIDALQKRMTSYVDKICDPSLGNKAREFLRSKLKDDYMQLKKEIVEFGIISENTEPVQYEIFDRKTGLVLKNRGPYSDRARAARAVDRLDNAYGAYRYGYRPINTTPTKISEAVHKLPLSHHDFEVVKKLFENPIPAAIAPIYLADLIDDDELNDQIKFFEDNEPNKDIRFLVAEWIDRVMPDQMYRFREHMQRGNDIQQKGLMSPLHGYNTGAFKGTNDPITGNAYGRY